MPTHAAQPTTSSLFRTLSRCIEACADGERSYAVGAEAVREPVLRTALRCYAKERGAFVRALHATMVKHGGFPFPRESRGPDGALGRGFGAGHLPKDGRGEGLVLADCAREEWRALTVYERALAVHSLPALPIDVRTLLREQHCLMKEAHDDVLDRLLHLEPRPRRN